MPRLSKKKTQPRKAISKKRPRRKTNKKTMKGGSYIPTRNQKHIEKYLTPFNHSISYIVIGNSGFTNTTMVMDEPICI